MDRKTLVVGQKVTLQSGPLFKEAFVDEVNEDSILVFIPPTGPFAAWLPKPKWMKNQPPRPAGEMPRSPGKQNGWGIYFRYDGTQCGVVEAGGVLEPRPSCTEFGPWELVER
jgi:hypothetical protein